MKDDGDIRETIASRLAEEGIKESITMAADYGSGTLFLDDYDLTEDEKTKVRMIIAKVECEYFN